MAIFKNPQTRVAKFLIVLAPIYTIQCFSVRRRQISLLPIFHEFREFNFEKLRIIIQTFVRRAITMGMGFFKNPFLMYAYGKFRVLNSVSFSF